MLTEFIFLQGHKLLDWSLFTGSHGWKFRPYYQFPRVWNYSYGNQGLHVENVYDPFESTAYQAGPLYNTMEWFVDAVGQGPNPQWLRHRQQLNRALSKADYQLHQRWSPQMKTRSLEKEQYYLKQFSLNLHVQWILKYWPTLLTNFVQFKILPTLVDNAPIILNKIESTARRLDYHFANKSIGYHLFTDLLEQLNPPLDDDDKIIPYDYIAESGSRMMKQYKDYCFLSEMMRDYTGEVSKYGQMYEDFVKLAKEEKYSKMAQGNPFAGHFQIPSIDEYCLKFHNFDLKTRSRILMDLKRVTGDYRAHFGPFDLCMATLHKFFCEHTTPAIYGQYRTQKQMIITSNEFSSRREANYLAETGTTKNTPANVSSKQGQDFLTTATTKYNPLNTLYRDSRQSHELTMEEKLQQLRHDFELTQSQKIFDLDRSNVKYIRTLYNERDAPLHSLDQLPKELTKLHTDIMSEMLTVLPQSIHDETLLKPLFEDYYNNRVNQHIYKYYPSILEREIKEDLDLKYDRTASEQYSDYIHERVDKRRKQKEERAAILAPYEAIRSAKNNMGQYQVNKKEFDYAELQIQDLPYDSPFLMYPGDPKLNTDDPSIRYQYLQQRGYQKMLRDIQDVEKIEKEKALKMTHGWSAIQRRNLLFNEKHDDWGPSRRINQWLPPMRSTKMKNIGEGQDLDLRPERFTKDDIRMYSKIYPGVQFDQVLRVLDDAESYRPSIKHPAATKESARKNDNKILKPIMDWEGSPRRFYGNDSTRNWANLAQLDELERFRQDNQALVQLYKNHFHATDDNPSQMKHNFILSKDVREMRPRTQ